MKGITALVAVLIFGFMLISSNYSSFAQAQSNRPDGGANTNLTMLSNSTFDNNTSIELQNKTVTYFDDAKGYLVYQLPLSGNNSNLPVVK